MDVGPNRIAVMAALRGPLMLSPGGAAELVRGGVPIVVAAGLGGLDAAQLQIEEHLKTCGATVERWTGLGCLRPEGNDGSEASALAALSAGGRVG